MRVSHLCDVFKTSALGQTPGMTFWKSTPNNNSLLSRPCSASYASFHDDNAWTKGKIFMGGYQQRFICSAYMAVASPELRH